MIYFVLAAALAGCAAPRATTPMPTDDLQAVGTGATAGEATEAAIEAANDFCHRWRAAASVKDKEMVYQGSMSKGAQTAVTVARDVAAAAGEWLPAVGGSDAYESTVTYRCY